MKPQKHCHHCKQPLGLGVIRYWFHHYCGVRCRDMHRTALLEEAKRQKSVSELFKIHPTPKSG